ncbi:ADOP family duplicated permease [Telmatobacter sp. DSM 110680]|uniref:ADOP family duplicated permease n=1 Tax=Telmatobacter sp. DSM 110680 TaxID=3036704 RepID=A0AAU7DE54_9BACT
MRGFLSNFRLAFRQLSKAPGFSVAVVLMLGAGIGAATAIFSLVEGVLLRPLAFQNPERLVALGDHVGENTGIGVTAPELVTYEKAATAFSSAGGYTHVTYELASGGTPEVIHAARMEARTFETLGVAPMLGRAFTQQEDSAHAPIAVISYAMWLNHFHRDPNVLGTSIVLDRKTYTIVGVMPREFEFPMETGRLGHAQLWVPMSLTADEVSESHAGEWRFNMVARLKDGVTVQQASQDADRVAQQIMRDFPAKLSAIRIHGAAAPLREQVVESARPLLRALFFTVLIVLMIACVNVAILMLVRAIRRRREYAVRLALGARAGAMIRDALAEGLLLSAAGGLLGLTAAAVALKSALVLLPESLPRIDAIHMDIRVAAFALLLAAVTGAICSVVPAFAAMRTNLLESLRESGRTSSGTSHAWLRSALVVAEIAIAMILLTVCVAFVRSYQKMLAVDPGFRPDHVLVAGYQLPLEQYATGSSTQRFDREVLDRLAAKPGIVAVGMADVLPASASVPMADYTVEGVPMGAWKMEFAPFSVSSGDYFRAMGIPLTEGRYFTREDKAGAAMVLIVNESMARHAWPGHDALGKRMHLGNPNSGLPWATVVGVVGDTKRSRDELAGDQYYLPTEQPASLNGSDAPDKLTNAAGGYIVLRSALPPEQMEQTLRAAVAEVDPMLALKDVRPMVDALNNTEAPRRFNTGLIGAFALGALLLQCRESMPSWLSRSPCGCRRLRSAWL